MPAERLQKLLAAAGYGSRRACEDLITAGRARINGRVAVLGARADPAVDHITLDGEPVVAEQPVYILLYKPRGVISSLRAQGERDTVRDLVPLPGRLYPVGRLDVLSEGLTLLTNDGDLTNRLTHPRYGHDKEYRVLVLGQPTAQALQAWRRGVVIEDDEGKRERTRPAKVEIESSAKSGEGAWLRVTMREGRKNQIRRVGDRLGLRVARLIRVRLGPLRVGALKAGEWRHLTAEEIRALKTATGARASLGRRRR